MREVIGDVWKYLDRKNFYIMIPTNGFVKNDGTGVMGAGVAAQAAQQFPDLPRILGFSIQHKGNRVARLTTQFYTFPTKVNWFDKSSLKLIRESIAALEEIALKHPDKRYVLPRPGCGNGKLRWKDVKPLLEHLPDNVLIINREEE